MSPLSDDAGSNDSHDRIEPVPAEELTRGKCANGQDRGESISENMEVGGTQVMVVAMIGSTCMIVVMVRLQD